MATVEETVQAQFPQYAWMLSIPEVGDLLRQAVASGGEWSPEKLTAQIQATNWWRSHAGSVRSWESMWNTDPASAQREWEAKSIEVGQMAAQLGVQIPWHWVTDIAYRAKKFGWSQAELRNALGQSAVHPGGSATTNLAQIAGEYLVPMSQQTINDWTQQIVSGQATEDQFRSYMREQAKSLFPSLSGFLDQGGTVKQYVAPYAEIAAKELEISPADVNFLDPKWSKALFQTDPKTGERRSMSLSDWQNEIRSNDAYQWDKTSGARNAAAELQTSLLKQFGALG